MGALNVKKKQELFPIFFCKLGIIYCKNRINNFLNIFDFLIRAYIKLGSDVNRKIFLIFIRIPKIRECLF